MLTGHKDNLDSSFCYSVDSQNKTALTDGLTATAGWKRVAVLQQHSAANKRLQVWTCCSAACNANGERMESSQAWTQEGENCSHTEMVMPTSNRSLKVCWRFESQDSPCAKLLCIRACQ